MITRLERVAYALRQELERMDEERTGTLTLRSLAGPDERGLRYRRRLAKAAIVAADEATYGGPQK